MVSFRTIGSKGRTKVISRESKTSFDQRNGLIESREEGRKAATIRQMREDKGNRKYLRG